MGGEDFPWIADERVGNHIDEKFAAIRDSLERRHLGRHRGAVLGGGDTRGRMQVLCIFDLPGLLLGGGHRQLVMQWGP